MDLSRFQYRGAPAEFVAEVGKVTLAAGWLEEAIYGLGEEFAIPGKELRALSASKAADHILAELNSGKPLPPWTGKDITVPVLAEWLNMAKGCLGERHQIIHSSSVSQMTEEGFRMLFIEQKARARQTPATAERVRSLRERIDRLIERSFELRVGILPQVDHGIYLSYWGGKGIMVIGDDEGYPDTRTREQLTERAERIAGFWDQFHADQGGEVRSVASPAGSRWAPPWFDEPW